MLNSSQLAIESARPDLTPTSHPRLSPCRAFEVGALCLKVKTVKPLVFYVSDPELALLLS